MGKDPLDEPFVEPEVTAPVTREPLTQWEAVGLTEDEWNSLDIPLMFRRDAGKTSVTASAPAVGTPAGVSSGKSTKTSVPAKPETASQSPPTSLNAGGSPAPLQDEFNKFKIDPNEIERNIIQEADRRWYQWEGPNRPRKSTIVKQVRKEYY